MKFLIAYDIADPKRLRRVSRLLERHAQRCQYSVFWFDGTERDLEELLAAAAKQIDESEDRLQAWRLASGERFNVRRHGTPSGLFPASVVIGRRFMHAVERQDPIPRE